MNCKQKKIEEMNKYFDESNLKILKAKIVVDNTMTLLIELPHHLTFLNILNLVLILIKVFSNLCKSFTS